MTGHTFTPCVGSFTSFTFFFLAFKYFVCVYPGCKTLLPKIVACEGPLIMMTGSLKKRFKKIKRFFFFFFKKRGGSLIRACSLIRSNTVNEVLKSKNKKHMVNDKFTTSEGTSITDKNEIVEQFNKYFTNIGSSLNSKLPKTGEDPIQHIKQYCKFFLCTH